MLVEYGHHFSCGGRNDCVEIVPVLDTKDQCLGYKNDNILSNLLFQTETLPYKLLRLCTGILRKCYSVELKRRE